MINVYDLDSIEFDEIVKRKLVYFTKNYSEAFTSKANEVTQLFVLEREASKAYQVMVRRPVNVEGFEGYYDLISPYGYGGWILEGEYNSKVFDEYQEYCMNHKIVCEFVRFDLFRTDISKYYGNLRFVSHNVVKNVDCNEEVMFAEFERRVQKNIRKANKNELSVMVDEKSEYLDKFLEIYYATMKRNEANNSYYFDRAVFEKILKQNAILFHVLHEEKIISTELVLYDELCSYSFLGGTLEDYFSLRPTEFLKYEIMKWSHNHKLKYFVLGGGYAGDDGIFNYKKGLSPNGIYNFYVGFHIFNVEVYDCLCAVKKVFEETSFFPAYRREI